MEINITQIGNSKGIRIPADLLKHYGFGKEAELIPQKSGIFIKPKNTLREGWQEAADSMFASGVGLLDSDLSDWLDVDTDLGL